MIKELTEWLVQLNFFDSSYEIKLLSYLIDNPNSSTVKEISSDLAIPDSKIYPALNKLYSLKLVEKDDTERPNKYSLRPPENIIGFLSKSLEQENKRKQDIITAMTNHLDKIWKPSLVDQEAIAHLFKGTNIASQIRALFHSTANKVVCILAPAALKYEHQLKKGILVLLKKDIRVELSIPNTPEFTNQFSDLINSEFKALRVKQSKSIGVSYIISDRSIMLNITHQGIGDVGYLSNDEVLVQYLDNCWNNESCSTPFTGSKKSNTVYLDDLSVNSSLHPLIKKVN